MIKFDESKRKIMQFLDTRGAAPALQIAAIEGIPLFELEMGLDELKQEGSIRVIGGEPLYKQVVIKRRGPLTTFTCKCGNCSYETRPFYDHCPKCNRFCWHTWRVAWLLGSLVAGAAFGAWWMMSHHG